MPENNWKINDSVPLGVAQEFATVPPWTGDYWTPWGLSFSGTAPGPQTIDLAGLGIGSAEAFGLPRLGSTVKATGITSADTVGTASLEGFTPAPLSASAGPPRSEPPRQEPYSKKLLAGGIGSHEAFGHPTLTLQDNEDVLLGLLDDAEGLL